MNLGTMKQQAQELIKQAYQAGYDRASETLNENWLSITSEAEEKGRNEAWAAAQKILDVCNSADKVLDKVFGTPSILEIMHTCPPSEAIEKLRAYEEKKQKDEIHVGDEVCSIYGEIIGIVTHISEIEGFSILWKGGSVGKRKNTSDFKKTGRTFPEITEVLKKIQEGGE